jgi:nucleoid DNA-binding protein
MSKKKFHLINELHQQILKIATTTRNGQVRIKRSELKQTIENTFTAAAKTAARGERVRFPVIGALVRKDVAARKGGKGINPFTKAEIMLQPRPASKKPRWSFPRTLKETFGNKRNW